MSLVFGIYLMSRGAFSKEEHFNKIFIYFELTGGPKKNFKLTTFYLHSGLDVTVFVNFTCDAKCMYHFVIALIVSCRNIL